MFLYKYNFFILLLFVSFGQFCLTVKGTTINDIEYDDDHHQHHHDDDEVRKEWTAKKLRICQQMFYITYWNYSPRKLRYIKISNSHSSIFPVLFSISLLFFTTHSKSRLYIFLHHKCNLWIKRERKKLIKIFLWKIYSGAWILMILCVHIAQHTC